MTAPRRPLAGCPVCPSCNVLSRQYGIVCEQNAALAARNRALEIQVGQLLTSADTLRAAPRGGGEAMRRALALIFGLLLGLFAAILICATARIR